MTRTRSATPRASSSSSDVLPIPASPRIVTTPPPPPPRGRPPRPPRPPPARPTAVRSPPGGGAGARGDISVMRGEGGGPRGGQAPPPVQARHIGMHLRGDRRGHLSSTGHTGR